jgi:stage II sporulation protein D
VTFQTLGFGHGVGMSQTGANAMAKNGADFHEILAHYYTGIEIVQL